MAHDRDGRTGRGRRPGQFAVAARFRLFLWLSARVDRPVSARIGREQWVYPSRFPRGLSSVGRSGRQGDRADRRAWRSEEPTSELQSLLRISYAVFCLKKKKIRGSNSQHNIYRTHIGNTQTPPTSAHNTILIPIPH